MCCICFGFFPITEAYIDGVGDKWDMCKPDGEKNHMSKFIGGPYDGLNANVAQAPEAFTHRIHDGEMTNVHTYEFKDGDYVYVGVTQEADTYTPIDEETGAAGNVPISERDDQDSGD